VAAAKDIGFPLLVKAVSGGGGKGMKLAASMKVCVCVFND
jgi:acetyl/propionyl-CoA carboxylase alpha subunit